MTGARAATAALLMVGALAVQAETVYVNDRVQVGVHQDKAVDSTILELVSSGTALEVIERDGALVQVKTPGGARGWVDARFLVAAEPGRARVQSLEEELAGAQAALADAQAKLVALEQNAAAAPAAAGGSGGTIPSDALREMQSLAEENQRLKQQVAELEAVQRMAREQASQNARAPDAAPAAATPDAAEAATAPAPSLMGRRWETWQMLLLASVLLLAFGAGGWLVDWGIRRRHGGFRV